MTTVLGVDGGGRKTYAIVANALGELLGAAASGPSNWELVGIDGARDAIAGAANAALVEAGIERSALDASVFGLAGVDWKSDELRIETVLRPLRLSGSVEIANDAFVALRAGTSKPAGLVVIAGTGSVVARASTWRPEVLVGRLASPGPPTLYTRAGDWPGTLAGIATGLLAVAAIARALTARFRAA